MNLELKDLAAYFPYKLKIIFEKSGRIETLTGVSIQAHDNSISLNFTDRWTDPRTWNYKPLMIPLSALTLRCINSNDITAYKTPLLQLAKIAGIDFGETFHFHNLSVINDEYQFTYSQDSFSFGAAYKGGISEFEVFEVINQLQLFEYLYQNHFWLGDQSYFEKGLIIDKRTVKDTENERV
mgnify:CR=1 FL=1